MPKDPEISPSELLAQLVAMKAEMETMRASQAGGFTPDVLEAMLSRVTKAASAGSELLASKMKPENADHLHKGPFEHPEGGLKFPKEYRHADGRVSEFHRPEIVYAGRMQRAEEVTYFEWQAINALSESLARSQRRIAREGTWSATVNDQDTRLHISVPQKTQDERSNLPSFLVICQELTTGARQKDQAELAHEVAALREELSRLTASVRVGAAA